MRAVMMYGPRDVRVEDRPDPALMNHTDAIIEVSAACVCESDLWPYRGTDQSANRSRWAMNTSVSSSR
jgi:threonine dehydrogenase-like Zn-dependent dehydrogenase